MESTSPAKTNTQLLDDKLAQLEKVRSWSPRLISKFEALLNSSEDFDLFRVNPYRFSAERGAEFQEVLDLFLHATKLGILKMDWQVICPGCGDSIESFGSLEHVHSHYFCRLCQEKCEANLDDYIQVSFTVSPQVRSISFHQPENLSPEDFFFKFHFSPYGHLQMPGNPLFVDILKQISLGAFYLEPGESRTCDFTAVPGALFGFDMIQASGFAVPISEGTSSSRQDVVVQITEAGHQPSLSSLSSGPVSLKFVNRTSARVSVMFNIMPADKKKSELLFDPFLTGKSLFNNQTFRQLYPSATLGEKGGIGVKDLTLLFTDLKGSTAMYDRIGDLKAFSLVQQHFERLTKAIQANGGAVVKTIGDAVMASFDKPNSAVKAAAEMLKEIEEFNKEHGSNEIILKIGVHRGASIAVTLNDRLDYFGQTVNIAARVQGLAGAEEIYLTKNVYLSPGVKELLEDFYVKPETASLKGIQKAMQVYKVTYEPPAKAATKRVGSKRPKKRPRPKAKRKTRRKLAKK